MTILLVTSLQLHRFSRNTSVVFFDVPGAAALYTSPSGHHILIDGGMTAEITEKLADHLPYWNRTIDAIILTHTDKDHLYGILEVLRYYKAKYLFVSGADHDSILFQEFIRQASQLDTRIIFTDETTDFMAGETLVDIISPEQSLLGIEGEGSNAGSLVGRIHGPRTILFTGDIGKTEENRLLRRPISIAAEILSAPHHGSKSSNSAAFIAAVQPQQVIIPASDPNPFGHPHQEVIEVYQAKKIPLSITGKSGDIHLHLSR